MPTIKIYPPTQLPDRNVTETQFSIWCEELEVYLAQEEDFAQFLSDGKYSVWQSKEVNADRITQLHNEDVPNPNNQASRAAKLREVRTKLRTVLAIIGKCVSEGHYNSVIRHSSSLDWIYNTLRSDYNIQKRGIHFFNILDVKYDPNNDTPVSFYNKYRTVIVNNLSKTGDIIKYKSNNPIEVDERMTPMLEDVILLNVLREIDARLPGYIKTHYNHRMQHDDKLMDLKSDILVNVSTFLEKINHEEENCSIQAATLSAFKQPRNTKTFKKTFMNQNRNKYCRLCHLEKLPREIFTSHNIGDNQCSSISNRDKAKLKEVNKLANMKLDEDYDNEDELAEMFGYSGNLSQDSSEEEVKLKDLTSTSFKSFRNNDVNASINYIQPVQSQILTVFVNADNTVPIHIDLDSGATINYCTEKEVLKHGFKVYPNSQLSKLGDGLTNIKAVGEIHETFFRNKTKLLFRAVVCENLNSPYIGGTLFMKENSIEQDLVKNVIHINGRHTTIQPTDHVSILPSQPIVSTVQVMKNNSTKNLSFKRRTLLPGQTYKMPVHYDDGILLSIEPHEENKYPDWPEPQFQTVENGTIPIKNNSSNPILLGSEVKLCKIRSTSDVPPMNDEYYKFYNHLNSFHVEMSDTENIKLISHNKEVSSEANQIIEQAHS